jgi:hypothetical protein
VHHRFAAWAKSHGWVKKGTEPIEPIIQLVKDSVSEPPACPSGRCARDDECGTECICAGIARLGSGSCAPKTVDDAHDLGNTTPGTLGDVPSPDRTHGPGP